MKRKEKEKFNREKSKKNLTITEEILKNMFKKPNRRSLFTTISRKLVAVIKNLQQLSKILIFLVKNSKQDLKKFIL